MAKKNPTELRFAIGDKVRVSGLIYGNGHGTGVATEKFEATMYVVGVVSPERYEFPIAVANIAGGRRQGWASQDSLRKVGNVVAKPVEEVRTPVRPSNGQASLAGTFTTARNIYMRKKAGMHGEPMAILPMGHPVVCKQGEYTPFAGTKWLYVETVLDGAKYVGYCSGAHLMRVQK